MIESQFFQQFISIAIIHLLAVMSPGPDFLLIVKQSLCHGRIISISTSIGIGLGIIIHILVCVFGLGIIMLQSAFMFNLILILGAIYIIYMGIQSLYTINKQTGINYNSNVQYNYYTAFIRGLLTNILNPKATLFFLSIYTVVLNPLPSLDVQLFYGLWMSFITAIWFSLLSVLLTNKNIVKKIESFGYKIQRIMGIVLIILGLNILMKIKF